MGFVLEFSDKTLEGFLIPAPGTFPLTSCRAEVLIENGPDFTVFGVC